MSKKARILLVCFGAIFFAGLIGLIGIYSQYSASEKEYTELKNAVIQQDDSSVESSDESDITPKRTINFELLKQQNPDFVAWIEVENTTIDYPVVQGADNQYYLKHSYSKTQNKNGTIFLEYNCNADFTDLNATIYGHNMKDGSMFSDLESLVGTTELGQILIHTEAETITYQISEIKIVQPEYELNYLNDKQYVTLVTCTSDGKKRVVVIAERM